MRFLNSASILFLSLSPIIENWVVSLTLSLSSNKQRNVSLEDNKFMPDNSFSCSSSFWGDSEFEDNECDSKTNEFSLMGERERNKIEVEFKKLADTIRDWKDLIDKRECFYKEEVTRLKSQLEEGNKVRKQYKEKEDQCQRLQDEVTSLGNEENQKDTTTKEFTERTSYCEGLEAMVVSLKEDLKNSNKQNEEIL